MSWFKNTIRTVSWTWGASTEAVAFTAEAAHEIALVVQDVADVLNEVATEAEEASARWLQETRIRGAKEKLALGKELKKLEEQFNSNEKGKS